MPVMSVPRIASSTLAFLADLERHNERPWFEANKERYLVAKSDMEAFADALLERMLRHDRIATTSGKRTLLRIYNDQRFHKDRPPYAPRFAGYFARVKPQLRGGYFFHVQPGDRSHITCGFTGPVAEDLKLIRQDIAYDPEQWSKLLRHKSLTRNFGPLSGARLRTAPRGFPKDHPAIDLLCHTQFLFRHPFTDAQVLSPHFADEMNAVFKGIRPFFDHMSEVLIADANGA
ncbi:MAG: DUF2461 domain-containing protein [Flavobacteriales bacterium]|nr:DUF2461 domain-containing protein [Flavobacteriales bacterium]